MCVCVYVFVCVCVCLCVFVCVCLCVCVCTCGPQETSFALQKCQLIKLLCSAFKNYDVVSGGIWVYTCFEQGWGPLNALLVRGKLKIVRVCTRCV